MRKEVRLPRFGPGTWVTVRDTGESVKVEVWSAIAEAYRVHSRKSGVQFVTDAQVEELPVHSEDHTTRYYRRCGASGCGSPLTPALPICPRCQEPTCTCGQCQCGPSRTAKASARVKTARKRVAAAVE